MQQSEKHKREGEKHDRMDRESQPAERSKIQMKGS